MKIQAKFTFHIVALFLCLQWVQPVAGNAASDFPHPDTYAPTFSQIEDNKAPFDDDSPYLLTFGPKQLLPQDMYEKLVYDKEQMKKTWLEAVGFSAPDLVGKIAPEIKPGTYSYNDKEKHPGLKALMWKDMYDRINPGGPPHAGNIPEFEIVPTRQYYYSLPVGEKTVENAGKTKQDDKGYILSDTWEGGYPFAKPSGPFKAQQIMYNVEKRYLGWGMNYLIMSRVLGYTDSLRMDFDGKYSVTSSRLAGRVMGEPYGWFDGRAQKRGEAKAYILSFAAPRDVYGIAQSAQFYLEQDAPDQIMMYIPSLRRVRKLSATDSQDPVMGQDLIYDDNEGWNQKLSPDRYPYTFEVVEEREFLVPAPTWDGSEYVSSDGLAFKNMKFERRPLYVVKLTQQDPNYVYSYRLFYIDKETFNFLHVENYDQKGRLYRTWDGNYSFFPEMGAHSWSGALVLMRDHIDTHSGVFQAYQIPAFWSRKDLSLKSVMTKGK